ncbi:hypothetical protein BDW42DRAFT_51682 [Aspergillus taichungensis]|uniref:Uncharacterized protein n=1 Tax=Aspergillus taichungensis TaxID=482145 RepID=A0A2J5HDD7_9EURO|nr:hypothetical protein BDW42DRAFT_51682 [Aspergillus taichungensis]
MKRKVFSRLRPGGPGGPISVLRTYSSLAEQLHQTVTSRQLPLVFDYLHTQPSYLLDQTINNLFKISPSVPDNATNLPSITARPRMPEGHHLVYFPPQVPLSELLPDGTDTLHYPGEPFTRRLWAGGSINFITERPVLDGSRAVCIETNRDVTLKGKGEEEKVVVRIERRIGRVSDGEAIEDVRARLLEEEEEKPGDCSIIENRHLIFMRGKSEEQLKFDQQNFGENKRILKPPQAPEFRHHITPNEALLFRFSALTFNAHSIHLDKTYTRSVEGYRNLLVHGPLTLMLMLTAIRTYLIGCGRIITQIDYRNISPLYVGEELAVCGKRKPGRDGAWEVWIEDREGSLAVRGTVQTRGS